MKNHKSLAKFIMPAAVAVLTIVQPLALAATYRNAVWRGFPRIPSVVRVGEDYYLVNSTFQYFPAIIISHSKDLVHWEQIGHVFTKSEDLDLTKFYDGCGIWAPDISYHDGEFYIFYCLVQLKKDRSVKVDGLSRTFSYSLDNKTWTEAGKIADASFLSDQGTPQWGFTGHDGRRVRVQWRLEQNHPRRLRLVSSSTMKTKLFSIIRRGCDAVRRAGARGESGRGLAGVHGAAGHGVGPSAEGLLRGAVCRQRVDGRDHFQGQ